MSNVKFANALVQNLSIFDGAGYDRMGSYADRFLSVLAEDGDLTPLVSEYTDDIRTLTNSLNWLRPEAATRANRLVDLTAKWVVGINREATEAELIGFLNS
jgi:hypothetical protein